MNSDELAAWEQSLAPEVDRLRRELATKEEQLAHIRRLRELEGAEGETLPHQPRDSSVPQLYGRWSLSQLNPAYLELDGRRFTTAGELLDDLAVPYYYSPIRGGTGDGASRQIIIWAKRNPDVARRINIGLLDGRRVNLWEVLLASNGRKRTSEVTPEMQALLDGVDLASNTGGNGTRQYGARLRDQRLRNRLTQAAVGRAVGVTASRISEIERCRASGGRETAPSPELRRRLDIFFANLDKQADSWPRVRAG